MNKLSLVALVASVLAMTNSADAKEHHKHHHKHHHHHMAAMDNARMMPSAEVVIAPGEELDVYGNPMLTQEDRQDVMAYIGKPLHQEGYAMGCGSCNTCCVPMECPCVPVCCPDTHGLFDGGLNKPGCCNNIQIWG